MHNVWAALTCSNKAASICKSDVLHVHRNKWSETSNINNTKIIMNDSFILYAELSYQVIPEP